MWRSHEHPKVRGLGILHDGFTKRLRATGEVDGLGWLEAWGPHPGGGTGGFKGAGSPVSRRARRGGRPLINYFTPRMVWQAIVVLIMVIPSMPVFGRPLSKAHEDPCLRLHSCPSDHNSYVSGDRARCDRCQIISIAWPVSPDSRLHRAPLHRHRLQRLVRPPRPRR